MEYEIEECAFCDNIYKDMSIHYGFNGITEDLYICNQCEVYVYTDEYDRLRKKSIKIYGEDGDYEDWLQDTIRPIIHQRKLAQYVKIDNDPEPTTTQFMCVYKPNHYNLDF